MSMNTSTSSPSPAQVQQDYQTLKRSHFTSASHEVKEGHVEQHCVQNQSPTKKRRVLSEVQIDEFTTDPRLEVNMVLSSTDSLNDSPIPHLQDNSGDEVTALQHLQQVARNAMVSVNGASTPLNSEPTCEQVENIRPVVETNIHEDHTASEDEQMLVVARPSCPMTPEGILLPYTGPDKHKPLVNAHDFRSMTLLQFTDCPNLIALVEQRGQNHARNSITSVAKAMFDDLWGIVWEKDMATLIEMDAREDSDFRKLMHLIMVEYQVAESKRIAAYNALRYSH